MSKKKIAILMASTGGGHRSAAEAISEGFAQLYDDCEVDIVDIWSDHIPFPLNRIGRLYGKLVKYGLWETVWDASNDPRRIACALSTMWPFVDEAMQDFFKITKPDAVIVVHPLFNHFSAWALRSLELSVPLVTVVTDLVTTHPGWICSAADLCLVPTEQSRQYVINGGLRPEQVRVTGLPVSLKFLNNAYDKTEARTELGLTASLPAVLLVGGGEGMGPVYKISRTVAAARPHGQMMIVAGRNERLKRRLERVEWEIPTKVFGFVTNMPELMAAADIIVTKAGPSTISEAFISGLPIVLSGFIPGQEEGNVDYVLKSGAGFLAQGCDEICRLVVDLFQPENTTLPQMAAASKERGHPRAALDIAMEVYNLLTAGHAFGISPQTSEVLRASKI
jgi:1,2-diacylglycerol 3-beta-galactosyltransferase